MKKVQILLSTYNGAKYLPQLLDSLLSQDYPDINILIRDDGSTDDTLKILAGYSDIRSIKLIRGDNIGAGRSFLELLRLSSSKCDYFSFCDQDDVWLPHKVTRAVNLLDKYGKQKPLLYCSSVDIVDEFLNPFKKVSCKSLSPSFYNAMVQNIAIGCTCVINKTAKNIVLSSMPQTHRIIMHDWWLYLVLSGIGDVVYDNSSSVLYRQHRANLIGGFTGYRRWRARTKRFLEAGSRVWVKEQAKEFHRAFGTLLSNENKAVLADFIEPKNSFIDRVEYIFRTKNFRQSFLDDLIFKFLIMLNKT